MIGSWRIGVLDSVSYGGKGGWFVLFNPNRLFMSCDQHANFLFKDEINKSINLLDE